MQNQRHYPYIAFPASAIFLVSLCGAFPLQAADEIELSDKVIPYQEIGQDFTQRVKPITEKIEDIIFPQNRTREKNIKDRQNDPNIEIAERRTIFGKNPFLGVGAINPGFETPFGAIWQPSLIIYGESRSALQVFDNGEREISEWANRLDIFANLYLTPTERLNLGLRPFDNNGQFSGYRFGGSEGSGRQDHLNLDIQSLYFEGDFGELFPDLDPLDQANLDYGFSIGRQPVNFQDGIMLNDSFDALGITRSSLFLLGSSATRITGMLGINEIHRGNNVIDRDAHIYGLFVTSDYPEGTYDLDLAYVNGVTSTGGDGLYLGCAQTRRFGHLNSTLRANFSWALDEETAAIGSGSLFTAQLSRTATYNHDLIYLNAFAGMDNYTSAARDPATGGPLGNIGILFAAAGLGQYSSPLSNQASNSLGAALGYQHYLDEDKSRQLILELGARAGSVDIDNDSSCAIATRYQHALGQHSIMAFDIFSSYHEKEGSGHGARAELRIKF
jgi:hypothetical protein